MLHGVMRDEAIKINSLGSSDERWSESPEYQLLCTAYFKSLEKASEYVAACKNDHDSAYLRL